MPTTTRLARIPRSYDAGAAPVRSTDVRRARYNPDMADEPYRGSHDTLDAEARARAAVRDIARWRDRLRSGIVLGFVLAGLAAAMLTIKPVGDAMSWGVGGGYRIGLLAGIAVWVAVITIGKLVADRAMRLRTPAAVARIAARWRVSSDELARDTRLA
jgi:hypothetical protein